MHKYPKSIIPQKTFKRRMDFGKLIDLYPDLLVLRQIKGALEDYMDEQSDGTKKLTDRIFSGTVQNLSMNLLGSRFKLKYMSIRPKSDRACKDWEGSNVLFSLNEDDYIIDEHCSFVCFRAKDIHNTSYPFPIRFNNEIEYNEMLDRNKSVIEDDIDFTIEEKIINKFIDKDTPIDVQVIEKLVHRPIMLNYWHITLDTRRPDSSPFIMPDEKLTSRDKRQLKAFKQHIMMHLILDIKDIPYNLKRKDYKKFMTCFDLFLDYIHI